MGCCHSKKCTEKMDKRPFLKCNCNCINTTITCCVKKKAMTNSESELLNNKSAFKTKK